MADLPAERIHDGETRAHELRVIEARDERPGAGASIVMPRDERLGVRLRLRLHHGLEP